MSILDKLTDAQLYDLYADAYEANNIDLANEAIDLYYERKGIRGAPVTRAPIPSIIEKALPGPIKGRQAGGGGEGNWQPYGQGAIACFIVFWAVVMFLLATADWLYRILATH